MQLLGEHLLAARTAAIAEDPVNVIRVRPTPILKPSFRAL